MFNALNTIKAVIRRDSEQASQLVQYLSTFFRDSSGLRSLLLSPTKLNM
ncbi:histidine kinase [Shigella sonnei]